ncbi:MAG: metal ABC transporter permease [Deltaproteobacteria bacterium]|nr:metal ABC transporter permease [Deltaproteobacteria bacterium]
MSEGAPTLREFLDAWDLFRDPVITGMCAGLLLGYLGVFIVLRRMVFVSAALSQAAALGVSLTFLADVLGLLPKSLAEPVGGALLFALGAMAFFMRNTEKFRLTREGLLGLGYLLGASGAVLVGDRITQEAHDVSAILFGPGVVVRTVDFYLTVGTAAVLLPLHLLMQRGLIFTSFDEQSARVQRLPVARLNFFLFLSIGVAVAFTTHAIGAMSVFAFSVLPAMTALALSHRLGLVLILSPALGLACGGGGYLLAFLYRFPVGASQTMLACACCGIAMLVAAVRNRD